MKCVHLVPEVHLISAISQCGFTETMQVMICYLFIEVTIKQMSVC